MFRLLIMFFSGRRSLCEHSFCLLFCQLKKIIALLVVCCLVLNACGKNNPTNRNEWQKQDDVEIDKNITENNQKTPPVAHPKISIWGPVISSFIITAVVRVLFLYWTKKSVDYTRGFAGGGVVGALVGGAYTMLEGGNFWTGFGLGALGGLGGVAVVNGCEVADTHYVVYSTDESIEEAITTDIENKKYGEAIIRSITFNGSHFFYRYADPLRESYIKGDCGLISIKRYLRQLALKGILKKLNIDENIWKTPTKTLREMIVEALKKRRKADVEYILKSRAWIDFEHISEYLKSLGLPDDLTQVFETDRVFKKCLKASKHSYDKYETELKAIRAVIKPGIDNHEEAVEAGMKILNASNRMDAAAIKTHTDRFKELRKTAGLLNYDETAINREFKRGCDPTAGLIEHPLNKMKVLEQKITEYQEMLKKGEKKRYKEVLEKVNKVAKEILR